MRERGRLIAIEGPSAAGKTTLVRAAAHAFGWQTLAEAVDRLDPAPSLEYGSPRELLRLERKLLSEEARRYRDARRLCAAGRTVLADTGFLGPVTYTRGLVALGLAPPAVARSLERSLRSLLRRGAIGIPDLTVYLDTAAAERRRHARADRESHPPRLFRRHTTVGRVERAYFVDVFPAMLPARFRTFPRSSRLKTLLGALRTFDQEALPFPASRVEALELFSALGPIPAAGRRTPRGPNR